MPRTPRQDAPKNDRAAAPDVQPRAPSLSRSKTSRQGRPRPGTAVTPSAREEKRLAEARPVFLRRYAETGEITRSAREAGISRRTVYRWRDDDPTFRVEMEDAHAEYVESLEAEARRRAVEGVEKPVGWYRGVAGGTVREYSDTLLAKLLEANAPEKYAQRVALDDTTKLLLARLDLNRLPDHLLDRLAEGEHPAVVFAGVRPDEIPLLPSAEIQDAEIVPDDD